MPLNTFPQAVGFAVLALGGLVLSGWLLDVPWLKSVLPGLALMQTNTAISFVLLGLALVLLSREAPGQRLGGRACAALACGLAAITLFECLVRTGLRTDQWHLAALESLSGAELRGQMSFVSALIVLLLGIALLSLEARRLSWLTDLLVIVPLLLCVLHLTGDAFYFFTLPETGKRRSPLPAVLAFLALSLGILAVRPDRGCMAVITNPNQGGKLARWLLPAAVLVPFVLGWLRLLAEQAGLSGKALEPALSVLAGVIVFSGLVLWYAAALNRTDEARQRAEQDLREAGQRKDAFLAMLAHELRTPLATLLSDLQTIRHCASESILRTGSLERMSRQTQHLRRLVDDLLEVSRLAHGKVHLVNQRLDLARLSRVAAEDRRADLKAAGLTLQVHAPELPVWVQGDETRLTQCLNNLLDNAIKFAADGHVEVTVLADAEAGQAVLSIKDTGIGIVPEMLPRLFRPFEQADQGLERSHGGLGLGLALVKQLIELHNGQVEVASDGPGRGATFTIRLPLEYEPGALTEGPRSPSVSGRRCRILIVEDNKDAADGLRFLLELSGHEVRVAHNGPEGVLAAAEWQPEAVLSDIGLPVSTAGRWRGGCVCCRGWNGRCWWP